MLIDTHAHLNFSAFKNDLDKVIRRTLENSIWVVNVGSQYSTSKRAVEIAEEYEKGIFAAVGLHPIHTEERKVDSAEVDSQLVFTTRSEEFNYEEYKNLAQSKKVVAIGEIGLDYYYKPKTKKKLEVFKQRQKDIFLEQVRLAKELDLPLILHCRMANEDLLGLLNKGRGVMHCFSGSLEQARKYLELGFYIGLNGLIFKNVEGLPDPTEVINEVPLERILVETDAPYLTPPDIEEKRNEPLNVCYVAKKIAEVKNISYEEIADITTKNARELFRI
ncbi:TatD family hydrolase [Patescibacteria group bacterium]